MEGQATKDGIFMDGKLTLRDTMEGPILIDFCFMVFQIFEESLTVRFVELRKFS